MCCAASLRRRDAGWRRLLSSFCARGGLDIAKSRSGAVRFGVHSPSSPPARLESVMRGHERPDGADVVERHSIIPDRGQQSRSLQQLQRNDEAAERLAKFLPALLVRARLEGARGTGRTSVSAAVALRRRLEADARPSIASLACDWRGCAPPPMSSGEGEGCNLPSGRSFKSEDCRGRWPGRGPLSSVNELSATRPHPLHRRAPSCP